MNVNGDNMNELYCVAPVWHHTLASSHVPIKPHGVARTGAEVTVIEGVTPLHTPDVCQSQMGRRTPPLFSLHDLATSTTATAGSPIRYVPVRSWRLRARANRIEPFQHCRLSPPARQVSIT